MKKYKVNDIFMSIQGEGFRVGQPSIFLRMAKCNLSCHFCDTEFDTFVEMSLDDIVLKLKLLQAKRGQPLVITGGEPLLQITGEEIEVFREEGFEPHIETNGTVPYRDCGVRPDPFITVSPKKPFSELKIKQAHTLKILFPAIDPNITPERFREFKAVCYYLQPVGRYYDPIIRKLYELDKKYPNDGWRLSPRIHTFEGLKDVLK